MKLDWFDILGDWNPQFFREVKGHLKRRTWVLTGVTSVMVQLVLLIYFGLALPEDYSSHNGYCTVKSPSDYLPTCIKDAAGNVMVNWQHWWFDLFQVLSWAIPFVLLMAGVYLLISDLAKEEQRGTLNFIRLSPRSSQTILFGKLWGVPIVPYLAVTLAVPLHLLAALGARVSPLAVVGIYLFTLAVCSFFYAGSLLFAFLGGSQGWVGAIVVCLSYFTFLQVWQTAIRLPSSNYLGLGQWLGVEIGSSLRLLLPFGLLTFGIGTFWIWKAVNRRFRNPDTTLLSKRQSYLLTACFEVWMLGFVVHEQVGYPRPLDELMLVTLVNLLWFLLLAAALSPQRQTLLDWARYRRERMTGKRFWQRSIVRDLVWGEKSPAVFAIGLNLSLAIALFTPWILSWSALDSSASTDVITFQGFAGLLLNALFILICTTIAQMVMFMKSAKRTIWALVAVSCLIVLPPCLLGLFALSPSNAPLLWGLTAFSFAAFPHLTLLTVGWSLLGHLVVLTALTVRLSRQLQRAGESEFKALMASAN